MTAMSVPAGVRTMAGGESTLAGTICAEVQVDEPSVFTKTLMQPSEAAAISVPVAKRTMLVPFFSQRNPTAFPATWQVIVVYVLVRAIAGCG
jgi:hypothetical protein